MRTRELVAALKAGPDKVADFKNGPAVEKLLNAIRARIAALADPPA